MCFQKFFFRKSLNVNWHYDEPRLTLQAIFYLYFQLISFLCIFWVSRKVLNVDHTNLDTASKSHIYFVIYNKWEQVRKDTATGKGVTFLFFFFLSYTYVLHMSYLFSLTFTLLTHSNCYLRKNFSLPITKENISKLITLCIACCQW